MSSSIKKLKSLPLPLRNELSCLYTQSFNCPETMAVLHWWLVTAALLSGTAAFTSLLIVPRENQWEESQSLLYCLCLLRRSHPCLRYNLQSRQYRKCKLLMMKHRNFNILVGRNIFFGKYVLFAKHKGNTRSSLTGFSSGTRQL